MMNFHPSSPSVMSAQSTLVSDLWDSSVRKKINTALAEIDNMCSMVTCDIEKLRWKRDRFLPADELCVRRDARRWCMLEWIRDILQLMGSLLQDIKTISAVCSPAIHIAPARLRDTRTTPRTIHSRYLMFSIVYALPIALSCYVHPLRIFRLSPVLYGILSSFPTASFPLCTPGSWDNTAG